MGVAEEGNNEFGGTVRFVAAAEAAWQGNNVGLFNQLFHSLYRFFNLLAVLVADNHNVGLGAGPFKGAVREKSRAEIKELE